MYHKNWVLNLKLLVNIEKIEQNFVVLTDPIAVKMGRGEGGPGGRPAFVSAPNKRPLAPGRDQSERKRSNIKKKA